jgi:hypothetical protein
MNNEKIVSLDNFKTEKAIEEHILNEKVSEAVEMITSTVQIKNIKETTFGFSADLFILLQDVDGWIERLNEISSTYTRYLENYDTVRGATEKAVLKKTEDLHYFTQKYLPNNHLGIHEIDLLCHFELQFLSYWKYQLRQLKKTELYQSKIMEQGFSNHDIDIAVKVTNIDCLFLIKWFRMVVDEANKLDANTKNIYFALPYIDQLQEILKDHHTTETELLIMFLDILRDKPTYMSWLQKIDLSDVRPDFKKHIDEVVDQIILNEIAFSIES